MKRKAEAPAAPPARDREPPPPASLSQVPAGTSGTGPFVVYFPSRWEPEEGPACEWAAYGHRQRRGAFEVVAATVRGRGAGAGAGLGALPPLATRRRSQPPLAAAARLLTPPRSLAPPLAPCSRQEGQVDFVGTTANPEYSGALPCR